MPLRPSNPDPVQDKRLFSESPIYHPETRVCINFCPLKYVLLSFQAPLCDADAITIEKVSKTLSLSLTTMAQVVSGFLHCFETEMKPWCRRQAPVLSGTLRVLNICQNWPVRLVQS